MILVDEVFIFTGRTAKVVLELGPWMGLFGCFV